MSHNVEKMAAVRSPTWHHLENLIGEPPKTAGAMKTVSGLDWLVEKRALFLGTGTQVSQVALVRDTDESILGFANNKYVPYQNDQGFAFCQAFVDSGLYDYETAGSLNGGRVCWVLLKFRDNGGEFEVVPGDPIRKYLLLSWGHDGTHGINTRLTSVRVLCWNTLTAALSVANTIETPVIRHSKLAVAKLDAISAVYMSALARFRGQAEWFERLLSRPVTPPEKRGFVEQLFPLADEVTVRTKNGLDRIQSFLGQMADGLVDGSAAQQMPEGIRDTAYGLFMAATEANEHYLGGKRVKDRGANILDGQGAARMQMMEDMMNVLLAKPVGTAFV